jgi:CPA1 family monovalent cation:H+ antiporter
MPFETFLLVAGATAVAGVARRTRLSPPLLLVLAGLAASFIPGIGHYRLEPDVVLFLVLPPLLFAAAWQSSVLNFRQNLRPIGLLSVGLVLFTTVVVGFAVHAAVPDLPLAAAFTLGAIVSPPDAVAATAVGREVGLPRRLVTVLAGESLINDATALTAYRVAVGAATVGGFSLLEGFREFVVAGAGGLAIGLALAWLAERLLQVLHDPVLENTLVLLLPFVGYAAAEEARTSGVLAVVVAGLYLGHRSPRQTAATRLQGTAVWKMLEFLLESVVFALIGLQLTTVVDDLGGRQPARELVLASAVTLGVVIVARFVWMYPATYLPRLIPAVGDRDPNPPWQYPTVLAWAGMRGVVSLAAAIALAENFPQRDLILFLTFVVVIGTLLVQGLTLPALIRRLGVVGREEQQDLINEAGIQHAAANAAVARLEELLAEEDEVPDDVVERLREKAQVRQLNAWERLGARANSTNGTGYAGVDGVRVDGAAGRVDGTDGTDGTGSIGGPSRGAIEPPTLAFRRLRRAMIDAEREVFVGARNSGRIDDEVLNRVQRELDLEETLLDRD